MAKAKSSDKKTKTSNTYQKSACSTCGKEYDAVIEVCPVDGTKLTVISSQLAPGTVLSDRYEIVDTVAGGGMGKVYKARHRLMKRLVAIKAMHPFLVSSGAALKRFQIEAQALSQLSHPNVLTVFDFFISDDGFPYLVMDYLEGTNLSEILKTGERLDVARGLSIFSMVCSGLNHAHERGIIHRDIKPSNIMLVNLDNNPDFVKVIDFGIAKMAMEGAEPTKLTTTGDVFGSPEYMSPEQCRAKPLDVRSDIYSLGCVMYAAFSGTAPFPGQDSIECMMKHVNEMPVPLKEAAPDGVFPPGLDQVIFKAMAKEAENRYQSMNELREAIELIRSDMAESQGVTTAIQESGSINSSIEHMVTALRRAQRSESLAEFEKTILPKIKARWQEFCEWLPQKHSPKTYAIAVTASILVTALIVSLFQASNQSNKSNESNTQVSQNAPITNYYGNKAVETNLPDSSNSVQASAISQPAPAVNPVVASQSPAAQDPATLYASYLQQGEQMFNSGDYVNAQKYFATAHKISENFGQRDVRYMESMQWLGRALYKQGYYSQAKQAVAWASEAYKSRLGAKSPQALSCEKDLSMINKALNQ